MNKFPTIKSFTPSLVAELEKEYVRNRMDKQALHKWLVEEHGFEQGIGTLKNWLVKNDYDKRITAAFEKNLEMFVIANHLGNVADDYQKAATNVGYMQVWKSIMDITQQEEVDGKDLVMLIKVLNEAKRLDIEDRKLARMERKDQQALQEKLEAMQGKTLDEDGIREIFGMFNMKPPEDKADGQRDIG